MNKLRPRPHQTGALALLALAAFIWTPLAQAHGDEPHDDQPPPRAAAPLSNAALKDSTAPQRLPDGSLWVPKPAQHQLGLRTQAAQVQRHAIALELNGKVLPDPNAGGRVQATQAGRIEAGPSGLPMLGATVRKGQVLAYLRPVASSLERGNQQATLADLEAQYAVAERKLARYAQLEGSIPQKDIDAARIERDALRQRREAVRNSVSQPEALTAPVNGVLAASHVVLGQVVDARELLFDIVDPTRLMVEALVYDPAQTTGLSEASAVVPGGEVALRFAGGGQQLRDQAMPVLFRVMRSTAPLAVGQTLAITARGQQTVEGVAIPRSALVRRPSGDTIVWRHDAPERFSARVVRFVPLDAERVVVTQGLQAHDRVVTQGASLLAQVR
ncbi:efflux RND transporter periplasmic adaptor subunit [Aquabacterium sp. NJ1]|uniref:efflux RND transporter periplasmic adaptor subunit n=1 Tax=Aquabacterium sp. NJ1 TaxID=1538295 RepID=UPI00068B93EF|nr:HlyD family efflux transporter periplasmic adaptor subunit [Aquabacterium sp. NJ1]